MKVVQSSGGSEQSAVTGLHAIILAVNLLPATLVRGSVEAELATEDGEVVVETLRLSEMVPGFDTATGMLLIGLSLAAIAVAGFRSAWPSLQWLDRGSRFQSLMAAGVVVASLIGCLVQIQRGDQARWLPDLHELDSSLVIPFGAIASAVIGVIAFRRLAAESDRGRDPVQEICIGASGGINER